MMKKLGKKEIKELQKEFPEIPKMEYYYECNECLHNWCEDEVPSYDVSCPYCMCGDLHREIIYEDEN